MFAPLNGAPLNGGAAGLWVSATAEASATAQAVAVRVVKPTGSLVTRASEQAVCTRLAKMGAAPSAVSATSTGVCERHAVVTGHPASTYSVSLANAVRWGRVTGTASSYVSCPSVDAERWVLPTATSVATANIPSVNALRTARPSIEKMRCRSITWVDEGRLSRLRVQQVPATGSAIARSQTRGIANEWLGRGVATTTASIFLDRLWFIYSSRGVAEASAELSVDPSRIQVITGGALARAEIVASPTITRSGLRYSYFDAVAEATGDERAAGLRITTADLITLETEIGGDADSYLLYGVSGHSVSQATTTGDGYVNPWVRVTGVVRPTAESIGESIRYRWVGTSGVAAPMAGSSGKAIRYRWVGVSGELNLQAVVNDTAYVIADMSVVANAWAESALDKRYSVKGMRGEAIAVCEMPFTPVISTMHYPTAETATSAWTQADGLRITHVFETPLLNGNASMMRAVPRVNPDAPAPVSRTVVLAASRREIILPSSSREYRVA